MIPNKILKVVVHYTVGVVLVINFFYTASTLNYNPCHCLLHFSYSNSNISYDTSPGWVDEVMPSPKPSLLCTKHTFQKYSAPGPNQFLHSPLSHRNVHVANFFLLRHTTVFVSPHITMENLNTYQQAPISMHLHPPCSLQSLAYQAETNATKFN